MVLNQMALTEKNLYRELTLERFDYALANVFLPSKKWKSFHIDNALFLEQGEFGAWLGYPGCAKTTVENAMDAWQALRNWVAIREKRETEPLTTLIGSGTVEKARDKMTGPILLMLFNPIVRFLFGDIVDPNDSPARFNLRGISFFEESEKSFRAFGLEGGNVEAFHAWRVRLDDVVDWKNCSSKLRRDRLRHNYHGVADRALNPVSSTGRRGTLRGIGNHHHGDTIYVDWEDPKKSPHFAGRVIKTPALGADGKSTWEERFPTELLLARRQRLPRMIWLPLWMQEVGSAEAAIFKSEFFEYWCGPEDLPGFLEIFAGFDPSYGMSTEADYSSLAGLALDGKDRARYELWPPTFGWLSLEEQCKLIDRVCGPIWREGKLHGRPARLNWIGIEQPVGIHTFQQLKEKTDLPVKLIKQTKDKRSGMIGLQALHDNGKWKFIGPPESRTDFMENVGTFPDEWSQWLSNVGPPPPAKDDRSDAARIANALIGDKDPYIEALEQELEERRAKTGKKILEEAV